MSSQLKCLLQAPHMTNSRATCQKLYSFSAVFCRTTAQQQVLLHCASSFFWARNSSSVRLADSTGSPLNIMKNADMFYWTKLLNLFHNEYIIKNIFNADNADLLANFFVFEIIPTIDFFKGNINCTVLQSKTGNMLLKCS